jgi:hypothetical protein
MTGITPIEEAQEAVLWWFYRILEFGGLELHPVRECTDADDGFKTCEQCAPVNADFWSVYGRLLEGGVLCFEDFKTEAAARAFAETLLSAWPHLHAHGLWESASLFRGS